MAVIGPPPIVSPITMPTGKMNPVWVMWFQQMFQVNGGGSSSTLSNQDISVMGEWEVEGSGGGSGLMDPRGDVTWTTSVVAPGGTETQIVAIAKTAKLYKLSTNRAARVRIYSTAAAMAADASRPVTQDPELDSGCELEVTTGNSDLSFILKEASYANQDESVSEAAYLSVTNLDVSGTISVTLTFGSMEG